MEETEVVLFLTQRSNFFHCACIPEETILDIVQIHLQIQIVQRALVVADVFEGVDDDADEAIHQQEDVDGDEEAEEELGEPVTPQRSRHHISVVLSVGGRRVAGRGVAGDRGGGVQGNV